MEVGDKVYCIKTLSHYSLKFFTKGKEYTIAHSRYGNIRITDDVSGSSEFNLLEPNNDQYKFNEYFITNKEYRKQKLLKIKKYEQNV